MFRVHRGFRYLMLVGLAGVVLTVYLYLGRPRTLMDAIAHGDVRDVEKFLQKEGLETGPSAPPYLMCAIYRPLLSSRTETTLTDEEKARKIEITYKMVKLLVEHGADINQPTERVEGDTPLTAAIHWRMMSVAQYLIEHGASLDRFNNRQESPLMKAASITQNYNIEIVNMLLDHNAKETINHVDNEGNSALHRASDVKIVELLLEKGADPEIKNGQGQTPLEQARKYNWKDKVAILEKYLKTNDENGTGPAVIFDPQKE